MLLGFRRGAPALGALLFINIVVVVPARGAMLLVRDPDRHCRRVSRKEEAQ